MAIDDDGVRIVPPTPHYRTLLANERTFLGWQGMSLSLIVGSIAVQTFSTPRGTAIWSLLAVILAVLAVVVACAGWWRWRQVDRAVRTPSHCVSLCDEEAITPI